RRAGVPADLGRDGLRPPPDRRPQPPRPRPGGGSRTLLRPLGDPAPERDVPEGAAGILRRRDQVRHAVSPRPVGRRDGGRLWVWGAAWTAARRSAEGATRARDCPLPGLCPPAGGQRLWGSGPLVMAARWAVHGPLVPELPQVSAVATLPAHDPGSCPPPARLVGAGAPSTRPAAARLWPGADVLLPGPPPADPRPGARRCAGALRSGDLRCRAVAGGLRLRPARGLRHLAGHPAGPLPGLPLVRGGQTAPPRRLAELSLTRQILAAGPRRWAARVAASGPPSRAGGGGLELESRLQPAEAGPPTPTQ